MSTQPVIIAQKVSKVYPQKPQLMRVRRKDFLSQLDSRIRRKDANTLEFHALRDITFSIHAGESVGLIGANGAGKSTLLRVLTGITAPTTGSVQINGKFGELFSLNSGFNADLSGRKNIFLIASIKGIPEHVILQRVDQIIAFSELGGFIDQPVKTYSSGMRGRLGFSILINLLPDIVFIDEALSTGDRNFRQKCHARLNELIAAQKTIVIVSHSTQTIAELCQRVIWLDRGEIAMDGPAVEVIAAYESTA